MYIQLLVAFFTGIYRWFSRIRSIRSDPHIVAFICLSLGRSAKFRLEGCGICSDHLSGMDNSQCLRRTAVCVHQSHQLLPMPSTRNYVRAVPTTGSTVLSELGGMAPSICGARYCNGLAALFHRNSGGSTADAGNPVVCACSKRNLRLVR